MTIVPAPLRHTPCTVISGELQSGKALCFLASPLMVSPDEAEREDWTVWTSRQMNCPRDQSTLSTMPIAGINVQTCDHCDGFWIDKHTLQRLYEKLDLNVPKAFTYPGFSTTGLAKAEGKCPSDGSQMVIRTYRGVDIEVCPSCLGIWLDAGESQHIAEIWRLAGSQGCQKTELAANVAIHTDIVESTVDAGTDVLEVVLEFIASALDCIP